MKRLKYSYAQDKKRCYAGQWLIKLDTMNIELLATTNFSDHEINLPFRFFEGSISIEGLVNGTATAGKGFAELLHSYQQPEIQITYPSGVKLMDPHKPLRWETVNPDDGNKLQYDIETSYDKGLSFNKIKDDLKSTSFFWNPSYFMLDTSILFRITGYSNDSTLNTQITQDIYVLPLYREYEACTGGVMSFTIALYNPNLRFQWLKEGNLLPGETDSTLNLDGLQLSSSGEYSCIVKGFHHTDTTLAFSLSVGDEYSVHEYITLCEGDEFLGHPLEITGFLMLSDTLLAVEGCDSIINYHILVDLCTSLNEKENSLSTLAIPDYTHQNLILKFPDSFTGSIYIADLNGRFIINEQIVDKKLHSISMQYFKTGIYIIRCNGTFNSAFKFVVSE